MSKCNKDGGCKKNFEDKAKKPHHHGHDHKPAKPANDQCPAKPADGGGCCPSKKDKCCP